MIYSQKEYDEYFKKYNVEPEIISDGDEFYDNYGTDFVLLTDKHIKAIQEGKVLYIDINGGEYCCLLKKKDIRQKVGYNINKDELVRALQYDREQYQKGYEDGKSDVLDKIRADIEEIDYWGFRKVLEIINKYKTESEVEE